MLLTRQTVDPESPVLALPSFAFGARHVLERHIVETIPLLEKQSDVETDLRFEFHDAFLREDMRDDLAFSGVFVAVASVENSASDGDKGVVEVRLKCAVSMSVYDVQCVWFRNGHMIGSNTNYGP